MSKSKRIAMIIVVFLTVVCILAVVMLLLFRDTNKAKADTAQEGTEDDYSDDSLSYRTITCNGKTYTYKKNISTLLFMGIDQHEPVTENGYEGTGGRSDCLILFILDGENKTTKMLEISRDSMVNVAVYDLEGAYALDMKMQITMQYAYGDGANKSCRLTKEAVSELLYGIPINTYLSMNIDGIRTVTDAVGGVTLTVPEDYTYVDPAFEKGKTITLDGEMAEKYVRKRDITVTGSNDLRMERQMQYIKALVAQLQNSSHGVSTYQSLLDQASPYLVTDMDADDMLALSKYTLDEQEYKVPGKTVEGIANDEYHVDEEALKSMIVELFYDEN
ncbi:MAG: LCP family protein [Clostridiaceae bacterium]|nr:LCP family protein [Clostridiaceae bacterium]